MSGPDRTWEWRCLPPGGTWLSQPLVVCTVVRDGRKYGVQWALTPREQEAAPLLLPYVVELMTWRMNDLLARDPDGRRPVHTRVVDQCHPS